jgi:hypothetical protein
MPSIQLDAEPTVLVVGDNARHVGELETSLTTLRVFCERASIHDVEPTAVAVAPDLVLLVGDAATRDCDAVVAALRRALRERLPPIAVVLEKNDFGSRLGAFQRGAVATFPAGDDPDVLAARTRRLLLDLATSGGASGDLGETSLDELLATLSHELRAELCKGSEPGTAPLGLVFGPGKPLAIAVRDFVVRVKRSVVTATPLPASPRFGQAPPTTPSVSALPAERPAAAAPDEQVPSAIPTAEPAAAQRVRVEAAYRRARLHLQRPLTVGSLRFPLWLAIAVGTVGVVTSIALVSVLSLVFGSAELAAPPPALSAPAPKAGSAASEPPAARPKTRLELASSGDPTALEALLAIGASERTAEQALAVAIGQQAQVQQELERLMREVGAQPELLVERKIQRRLIAAARDPATGPATLKALVAVDAPESSDLIFEVWTGTSAQTAMTELAQSLVHTLPVRQRASPALDVALALRTDGPCDAKRRDVERALELGDRRSLLPLGKLTARRGCGPRKADDCYACLRDDDTLQKAISAVRRRPPPL